MLFPVILAGTRLRAAHISRGRHRRPADRKLPLNLREWTLNKRHKPPRTLLARTTVREKKDRPAVICQWGASIRGEKSSSAPTINKQNYTADGFSADLCALHTWRIMRSCVRASSRTSRASCRPPSSSSVRLIEREERMADAVEITTVAFVYFS